MKPMNTNSHGRERLARGRTLPMALAALALAAGGVVAGVGLAPRLTASTAPAVAPAPLAAASLDAPRASARVPDDEVAPPSTPAQPAAKTPAHATPAPARATAAAPAPCAVCGVVESVQAVKQKGPGTGVGAVAGGVVGAALGNQIGKGAGRTAMTVLGAVGGGLAGHEIEKNVRSQTLYDVQVRMDDGSTRVMRLAQPWAVGARVTVDGQRLHASQAAVPRTIHTSGGGD